MSGSKNCSPISGNQLNEFITRFHEGPLKFRVSPGWVAFVIWIILTACYGAGFYFFTKNTWTNDDNTIDDKQLAKTVAEGLVGYFVIVLPLCLLVYAWRMFAWANMGYELYYPNAKWHGGIFWGSATLIVMIGVVVGLILIRNWEKASLSVFWIFALVVMVIAVSVSVGVLAHVLIQCKLTADPKYVSQYNCAQDQVLKHVQDLKASAEEQKATATAMLKNAKAVQNAITNNATTDVAAASRLIKSQPELVGKQVSRAADEQSRPPQPQSEPGALPDASIFNY